jgi:F0F1-type ATP synthase membrane subunit c/vacuolar-type H+-ATPase subunit K
MRSGIKTLLLEEKFFDSIIIILIFVETLGLCGIIYALIFAK